MYLNWQYLCCNLLGLHKWEKWLYEWAHGDQVSNYQVRRCSACGLRQRQTVETKL